MRLLTIKIQETSQQNIRYCKNKQIYLEQVTISQTITKTRKRKRNLPIVFITCILYIWNQILTFPKFLFCQENCTNDILTSTNVHVYKKYIFDIDSSASLIQV